MNTASYRRGQCPAKKRQVPQRDTVLQSPIPTRFTWRSWITLFATLVLLTAATVVSDCLLIRTETWDLVSGVLTKVATPWTDRVARFLWVDSLFAISVFVVWVGLGGTLLVLRGDQRTLEGARGANPALLIRAGIWLPLLALHGVSFKAVGLLTGSHFVKSSTAYAHIVLSAAVPVLMLLRLPGRRVPRQRLCAFVVIGAIWCAAMAGLATLFQIPQVRAPISTFIQNLLYSIGM